MKNDLKRLRALVAAEAPTYIGKITGIVAPKIYEVRPLDKPESVIRCTSDTAMALGTMVFFQNVHITGTAPSGNFTTIEV